MKEISVTELKSRQDNGEKLCVLDVREEWEYQEFNIGARNVPLSVFMLRLDELEEWKEKEVIVHCKSGVRSVQASLILEQNGFKNVKNLTGGIESWKSKFPV
jgi:rhodanese-related sulfurtransferase